MASKTDIAKLALQHLGDRFDIASITEASVEAEQMNLLFDTVRDATLKEHPWTFAKKYTSPTYLDATVPAEWTYMFTYPDDCLKIIEIVNPLGRDDPPIPFDIAVNSVDDKVILCDVEEPEFCYIRRITDTYEYDAQFVLALSYRLAQYAAIPLTGDRGLMRDMKALADEAVGTAQSDDANESVEEPRSRDPDWIDARL
jgi:hypothetical protein